MRILLFFALFALTAVVSPLEAQLINDSGFDGYGQGDFQSADGWNWTPTADEFNHWYAPLWWQPVTDSDNPANTLAEMQARNASRYSLLQVIEDGANTTGQHTLRFDMLGNWNGYVYAVGYDSLPELSLSASPPAGAGLFIDGEFLRNHTALPGTHEMGEMQLSVDFGSGHEYIVISFHTRGDNISPPQVDNVHLTPEPLSLGILGVGGLLAIGRGRRRRRQLN
jgi:hypothetical protein